MEIRLQLNEPVERRSLSRIFYFRDERMTGQRFKVKFTRSSERTFQATTFPDGIEALERLLTLAERSAFDHVRLLNRGGTTPIDIAGIEFDVTVRSGDGAQTVSLLSGEVNQVLGAPRDSIVLSDCVTGARAMLARVHADLDGVKLAYRADPGRLRAWYAALVDEVPYTLYNEIQDHKRYGWALISRTGAQDDIHGRRFEKYNTETEHATPTPLYRGYVRDLLEELQAELGLIYRARLIGIRGFRSILPHHDGHDGTRFYRFHIPIIPNERCVFSCDGRDFVMDEPGRLYQFPAWKTHSVVNYGGERVHLLFTAYRAFPAVGL